MTYNYEATLGNSESLPTIVSWAPVPTGFDLKTSSPVKVKCLLVLYFLPKVLAFAFALPLDQGKQDYVIIHHKLTAHTSCAASSSFSRLGPSRVTFPSLSLRNSMKATGYTYKTITVRVVLCINTKVCVPWSQPALDRARSLRLARGNEVSL